MAKVLVTGSEGFIGQPLCNLLAGAGHEVTRFDKILGNDVTDIVEVRKAVDKVDMICHLASIVGFPQCDANPELARRVNVDGTVNVASSGKRVLYTSATSNYDGVEVVDEETPVVPKTLYAKTKLEAEDRLLKNNEGSVLPNDGHIVLRFGSLYGLSPRMRDDLLLHNMCRDAVNNGKLEIYQPDFIRPLTNILDAMKALMFFVSCKETTHGLYHVISIHKTKREMAEAVSKVTDCEIEYVEGKDKENRSYTIDTKKIEALGFSFNPDFDEEVSRIVGSYRATVCDN